MVTVNTNTKNAYMSDEMHKSLRIVFPELNLTYTNASIEAESMKLTETLMDRDSVEFVGCNASSFEISIYGITQNIKGKKIEAYITAGETEEIPLFKGIVDSAVIDSNKFFKKIIAYDVLYTKGNVDVVGWYNAQFPTDASTKTLKQLRDSLMTYIGITQVNVDLPNDDIVIGKQFAPKTLKSITVLKNICQINGCCGIINRNGLLDYRFVSCVYAGLYPSLQTFPSSQTIPHAKNIVFDFDYYEKLKHEEYFVKPMDSIQIRDSEDSDGVTFGNAGNKYIIQANMFAYGITSETASTMARNILNKLVEVAFYPCEAVNNGLPFVECGDAIRYNIPESTESRYSTNSFIVMSRTLSGIQFIRDRYSAQGEEEQSEFITDLQTQLDTIKRGGIDVNLDNYYTKEEADENFLSAEGAGEQIADIVDEQIAEMETPTGFNIVSCDALPSSRQANTLYCVRGMVIVV